MINTNFPYSSVHCPTLYQCKMNTHLLGHCKFLYIVCRVIQVSDYTVWLIQTFFVLHCINVNTHLLGHCRFLHTGWQPFVQRFWLQTFVRLVGFSAGPPEPLPRRQVDRPSRHSQLGRRPGREWKLIRKSRNIVFICKALALAIMGAEM